MSIRMLRIGIAFAAASSAPAWSQCEVPFSADYEFEFTSTWSADTLTPFPDNAHFSGFAGGSHNTGASFWSLGGYATEGIELMAEQGQLSTLIDEIEDAMAAGTALEVISGPPIGPSDSTSETLTLDQNHSLATVVAMIAPSPDWFVGVSGLNLFNGSNWLPEVTVELFAIDAGTDSGPYYDSGNDDTQPPDPISELTSELFRQDGELVPFGTFRFLRLTASCPDTDGDGLDDDAENDVMLDPLNPDTDGDGIGDAWEESPLLGNSPNNLCNSRVAGNATVAGETDTDRICAARYSIDVTEPTVITGGSHLKLVSPIVRFGSEFSAGQLTVTSANPCPACPEPE